MGNSTISGIQLVLHTCWQYSLVTSRCERGSGGGNVETDKEGERERGGREEERAKTRPSVPPWSYGNTLCDSGGISWSRFRF